MKNFFLEVLFEKHFLKNNFAETKRVIIIV